MNTFHTQASLDELRRNALKHVEREEWAQARAVLETVLQAQPRDVPTRMDLASVILQDGHLRDATRHLLEAIPYLPNNAPVIVQLAWHLCINGEIPGARACLDHLDRAPNPPAAVLAQQAELRWMIGEISVASALMERAVAKGIETHHEHYVHAMLLQFTGRIEEAEAVLLNCLREWPDYGDAAVILAGLRKQTPEANHLELLRSCLPRMPLDDPHPQRRYMRAGFESAIFKVLDNLGRYQEAWQSLAQSNALLHELNPYDSEGEAALSARFMELAEIIGAADAGTKRVHDGPTPIFIVGMPRSGTTLLDRMLSSHSRVVSAGEIQDFQRQVCWMADVSPRGIEGMLAALERSPDFDFAELGARYLEQTQWRAQGRDFYVDKLPINVRFVPLIRRALPHAPILNMVRPPMDVCYSNFKAMFGNSSPYCYDQRTLAHYFGLHTRLTNHWRQVLPDAMLDVSYSELVSDPEGTLRQVLAHCGLEVEEGCLRPERNAAPVATPSSTQVREPVHTRSIGEWQRYGEQLEPLRQALAAQGIEGV